VEIALDPEILHVDLGRDQHVHFPTASRNRGSLALASLVPSGADAIDIGGVAGRYHPVRDYLVRVCGGRVGATAE
jgi:hypothetical protein